jgi:hypothetical protein
MPGTPQVFQPGNTGTLVVVNVTQTFAGLYAYQKWAKISLYPIPKPKVTLGSSAARRGTVGVPITFTTTYSDVITPALLTVGYTYNGVYVTNPCGTVVANPANAMFPNLASGQTTCQFTPERPGKYVFQSKYSKLGTLDINASYESATSRAVSISVK